MDVLKTSFILLLLSLAGQENAAPENHNAFVVRISEDKVSVLPTAGPMTVGNCVVVSADGHAQLQLSRQEFYGRGTLNTYASRLNKPELARLQQLLDAAPLQALPPFVAPHTPLSVPEWHDVIVEVPRGAKVQHIGYFETSRQTPSIGTPQLRAQWSGSANTMQSVVEWFHAFKSDNRWVEISNPKSGFCGE